jgi:hypothetical protein
MTCFVLRRCGRSLTRLLLLAAGVMFCASRDRVRSLDGIPCAALLSESFPTTDVEVDRLGIALSIPQGFVAKSWAASITNAATWHYESRLTAVIHLVARNGSVTAHFANSGARICREVLAKVAPNIVVVRSGRAVVDGVEFVPYLVFTEVERSGEWITFEGSAATVELAAALVHAARSLRTLPSQTPPPSPAFVPEARQSRWNSTRPSIADQSV